MKTYQGSCHCGTVKFEADIDLARGTIKCNCTVCTKMRFWAAQLSGDAFRLHGGQGALREYRYGSRRDAHYFCGHCGIHTFSTGESALLGAFYAVILACLDNASPEELAAAPVRYLDGRNDNWITPPAMVRHL
ncbi:GFA family protein [Massilia sp. H6]|uniref:GFA family protein n=1 Tax=Massilia sp. H6 TaxID=2970464 RepID=UPI0021687240|nr:GFA family protein [Massilia sp. H6]UVW27500.1 GFA family protein [Massilia sp. H6]